MTVHVDDLTTEVTTEPDAAVEPATRQESWAQREQVQAAAERLARDQARTRAEGFDD
jgi:hypothetical protein